MIEAMNNHGISFVLCRHEGSAGFMADAIAQRTGGVGACIATLGPGATNLVSGVAGSFLERSRVLAIIAQIAPEIQGIYTHQILNQQAIFQSICKEYIIIHPQSTHPQLQQLLRRLTTGISAPIVLELGASAAMAPCAPIPKEQPTKPTPQADAEFASLVQQAQKPIFFVGCAELNTELSTTLKAVAEAYKIPILSTYRAKGILPETHPLALGACGLSPKVDAHTLRLLDQSDLIIAIGLDAVELRPNWLEAWDTPTISISPSDCANDLTIPLVRDIRSSAVPHLQSLLSQEINESSWGREPKEYKENIDALFDDSPQGPASMVRAIQRATPDDAVLSLDVGAHRITASHVWKCKRPRTILQSNGFSSMGVGLPMAIATKLNEPNICSIALCGDMGFAMSLGELGVIQDHNLHLIVIYFADKSLTLIEVKQKRAGFSSGGMHFHNPDPIALAQAFGGTARITTSDDELEKAVREACAGEGLWIIEAQIDPASYQQQL
jgi:acetolactate synthase-1/2/3 large subunit